MADRIKAAHHRSRLGVTELAEAVGVAQAYMSNILAGRVRTKKYLQKIAEVLSVSVDWLEFGDPDKAPEWAGRVTEPATPYQAQPKPPLQPIGKPVTPTALGTIHGTATAGTGGGSLEAEPVEVRIAPGTVGVRIHGNSGGTTVMDRQIALLSPPERKPKAGNPVVVQTHDGQTFCKRWFPRSDGWVVLQSMDSTHEPVLLRRDDIADVRVIWAIVLERH